MNAKELRIGNYVQGLQVVKVSSLEEYKINGYNSGSFSGIPLTEELLLKCGLDQVGTSFVSDLIGVGSKRFILNKFKGRFFIEHVGGYYIRVASLHELQNIYLFITKRELKIEI